MKSLIRITPDGNIIGIRTEPLAAILTNGFGEVITTRASHVLPCHAGKRFAFRLIRAIFGERGRIAEWQRRWRGPWQVTWANCPERVVFTHPSRRVCINWEIKSLNERLTRESNHV